MNILAQDQDSEMSSEMAHYPDWSAADQYDSQSEGLAAKLEDVNQPSAKSGYKRKAEDSSEADSEDEEDGTQTHNDNGRRVRARSLIDDEQLAVLKGYYAINPRPKKEEIIMIANYINFPTRVVQVHVFPQKILQKKKSYPINSLSYDFFLNECLFSVALAPCSNLYIITFSLKE